MKKARNKSGSKTSFLSEVTIHSHLGTQAAIYCNMSEESKHRQLDALCTPQDCCDACTMRQGKVIVASKELTVTSFPVEIWIVTRPIF
jgi:hypothetical protein